MRRREFVNTDHPGCRLQYIYVQILELPDFNVHFHRCKYPNKTCLWQTDLFFGCELSKLSQLMAAKMEILCQCKSVIYIIFINKTKHFVEWKWAWDWRTWRGTSFSIVEIIAQDGFQTGTRFVKRIDSFQETLIAAQRTRTTDAERGTSPTCFDSKRLYPGLVQCAHPYIARGRITDHRHPRFMDAFLGRVQGYKQWFCLAVTRPRFMCHRRLHCSHCSKTAWWN